MDVFCPVLNVKWFEIALLGVFKVVRVAVIFDSEKTIVSPSVKFISVLGTYVIWLSVNFSVYTALAPDDWPTINSPIIKSEVLPVKPLIADNVAWGADAADVFVDS